MIVIIRSKAKNINTNHRRRQPFWIFSEYVNVRCKAPRVSSLSLSLLERIRFLHRCSTPRNAFDRHASPPFEPHRFVVSSNALAAPVSRTSFPSRHVPSSLNLIPCPSPGCPTAVNRPVIHPRRSRIIVSTNSPFDRQCNSSSHPTTVQQCPVTTRTFLPRSKPITPNSPVEFSAIRSFLHVLLPR